MTIAIHRAIDEAICQTVGKTVRRLMNMAIRAQMALLRHCENPTIQETDQGALKLVDFICASVCTTSKARIHTFSIILSLICDYWAVRGYRP